MNRGLGLKQDNLGRLFCDITGYLDSRLLKEYRSKGFRHYLVIMDRSDVFYIRFPNDIRGAIYINEDTLEITSIVMYKKTGEIYNEDLDERLNTLYVGKRLV